MARMVATKAALSIRVDALADADVKSESDAPSIGIAHRAKLESRLRALEYSEDAAGVRRFANADRKQQQKFEMKGETKTYNTQADFVTTQRESPMETAVKIVQEVKDEKKKAKEEKKAKKKAEKEAAENAMDVDGEGSKKDKKEKKRKRRESEMNGEAEEEEKPKVCPALVFEWRRLLTVPFFSRRRKRSGKHGKLRKRPPKLLLPMVKNNQRKRKRSRKHSRWGLFSCSVVVFAVSYPSYPHIWYFCLNSCH